MDFCDGVPALAAEDLILDPLAGDVWELGACAGAGAASVDEGAEAVFFIEGEPAVDGLLGDHEEGGLDFYDLLLGAVGCLSDEVDDAEFFEEVAFLLRGEGGEVC